MSNTTVVAFSAEKTFFIAKNEKTERRWDTVTVIKCQIEWSYFKESEYLIFLKSQNNAFQIVVMFLMTSLEKYLMNPNQNKTSSLNIFWNSVSLLRYFERYLILPTTLFNKMPEMKRFWVVSWSRRVWNCWFEVQNQTATSKSNYLKICKVRPS